MSDYKIIGHGSFGYVLLDNNNTNYLIKIFFDCLRPCHNINAIIKKNLENNRILLELNRKDIGIEMEEINFKILPKIDDCENIANIGLKMENLKNPNLKDLYRNNFDNLEIINKLDYISVKNAIEYNIETLRKLHNIGYLHLDIRLENIIPIFDNGVLFFKIIDYDFMTKIENEDAINIALVNEFFPPEHKYLARRKICGEKCRENYLKIMKNYWETLESELEEGENIEIFRKFEDRMIEKYTKKKYKEVYKENIELIENLVEKDNKSILDDVDFYMYGLMMYIFLTKIKKIKGGNDWDELIEKMIDLIDIGYKNRNKGIL